jgi:hypothetical protein
MALEANMFISSSRWIAAATDAALSTAVVLLVLAASLLFALLSVPDTHGAFATEIGVNAEAATLPSCLCFAPELDVANTLQAARVWSEQR